MKLRIVGFLGLVLSIVALPSVSFAGEYNGLAQPYWFNNGFYINVRGMTVTNSPSCRNTTTRTFAKLQEGDYNDPVFKNKYAILLAAWFAQRPVFLQGTGQCTGEGDEIIFVVVPGS